MVVRIGMPSEVGVLPTTRWLFTDQPLRYQALFAYVVVTGPVAVVVTARVLAVVVGAIRGLVVVGATRGVVVTVPAAAPAVTVNMVLVIAPPRASVPVLITTVLPFAQGRVLVMSPAPAATCAKDGKAKSTAERARTDPDVFIALVC